MAAGLRSPMRPSLSSTWSSRWAQGAPDARGIAVLRVAADARIWWIVGCKSGVGFDYFENYRSVPPTSFSAPPRAARLVLDGARTVRVHAVDAAGRPVEGVEFYPVTSR